MNLYLLLIYLSFYKEQRVKDDYTNQPTNIKGKGNKNKKIFPLIVVLISK